MIMLCLVAACRMTIISHRIRYFEGHGFAFDYCTFVIFKIVACWAQPGHAESFDGHIIIIWVSITQSRRACETTSSCVVLVPQTSPVTTLRHP